MLVNPKPALLMLSLLVLGGCSWFGGDDEEVVEPKKLESFESEVELDKLWDRKIGGGAQDTALGTVPAISGSRIFVASPRGTVFALDTSSGDVRWEVDVEDLYSSEERKAMFPDGMDVITGGVGVGGDLAVVGIVGGEIVALNRSDGSVAWRADVTSEVLAPPAVDRDLVVAQSVDGKVAAYDALDGTRQWLYTTSVPRLTLRGTATPLLLDELVIAGFANGRVIALDRRQGLPVIDERIAIAQGKSDLERLVDVDGRMVMRQGRLFAASYQGNVTSINLGEGRAGWRRPASSLTGLGEGFGNIYVAHADGRITALNMENSEEVWENDGLMHRDITAPVSISSYIVVGDFDGYIHLIAQSDGRFVGRAKAGNSGIISPPVVEGRRIYVLTKKGRLLAYELR